MGLPEKARSERWNGPNAGLSDEDPLPPTPEALARNVRLEEAARLRAGGVARRPDRHDGWRLTEADEALLRAALRYSAINYRQASAAFYGGVLRTTERRIGYLREAGLVRLSRDDEWAGRVLIPTAAAARLVGEDLPVELAAPRDHPGERLLHKLAIADGGLQFEGGARYRVLTERELRTLEATPGAAAKHLLANLGVRGVQPARDGKGIDRWLCVPTGANGEVHYPDMVLVEGHGDRARLVAVEVEITEKSRQRLRTILRGYRDAQIFHQVLYFTIPPVGSLLHGWRDHNQDWAPGILQDLRLLPDGPPVYDTESRVRVLDLATNDPGVQYRIEITRNKALPAALRTISRAEWKALRDRWEADEATGKVAQVPFLRWWRNIEIPRQTKQAALANAAATAGLEAPTANAG